jgi:thioredoxin 1
MTTVLYFILAIVAFFLLLRVYIWFSGFRRQGKPVPELGGELGQKIKDGQRWLLYFYSPACSACRHMTPIIDALQGEKKNVMKINIQNELNRAQQLGVLATPATLIVENSRIQHFILGARSENFLRKLIQTRE